MNKPRETNEVADATVRLIRAVGRRIVASGDLSDLASVVQMQAAVDQAMEDAVRGLRSLGFSDREIGEQLGVTKQAVAKRWPRQPLNMTEQLAQVRADLAEEDHTSVDREQAAPPIGQQP